MSAYILAGLVAHTLAHLLADALADHLANIPVDIVGEPLAALSAELLADTLADIVGVPLADLLSKVLAEIVADHLSDLSAGTSWLTDQPRRLPGDQRGDQLPRAQPHEVHQGISQELMQGGAQEVIT